MKKIKYFTKEIISFAIMLFIISNAFSYYRSLELNKQNFDLQDIILIDNSKYTYDTTKPLLVHFWATWCPICKVEAPNIQELSKTYNVLTISSDSGDNANVSAYLKNEKLDFKVLNDENYVLAKKFNIKVYPTTLIYDRNNKLTFSEVGYTSTLGLKLRMWWANI